MKIMLLNNQHLGMVVQWEDRFYKVRWEDRWAWWCNGGAMVVQWWCDGRTAGHGGAMGGPLLQGAHLRLRGPPRCANEPSLCGYLLLHWSVCV